MPLQTPCSALTPPKAAAARATLWFSSGRWCPTSRRKQPRGPSGAGPQGAAGLLAREAGHRLRALAPPASAVLQPRTASPAPAPGPALSAQVPRVCGRQVDHAVLPPQRLHAGAPGLLWRMRRLPLPQRTTPPHPPARTPCPAPPQVCTSELGAVAKLQDEFARRGVQLAALSCNDLGSHQQWVRDIEGSLSEGRKIGYPIVADRPLHRHRVSWGGGGRRGSRAGRGEALRAQRAGKQHLSSPATARAPLPPKAAGACWTPTRRTRRARRLRRAASSSSAPTSASSSPCSTPPPPAATLTRRAALGGHAAPLSARCALACPLACRPAHCRGQVPQS